MKKVLLGFAATGILLAGCTTTDPNTGQVVRDNTKTNAIIGAAVGAAAGYATNTNKGEQGRKNAIIGAGIGALGGAAVGNYMDKQQAELRKKLANTGVTVDRNGDVITLNMPSDVTFPVNGDQVDTRFYKVLDDVSGVLKDYPSTYIDVIGHANSTGADDYNQALSERRANSVANYMSSRGVAYQRIYVAGAGETRPIASNDTKSGRAQNRRVEVTLRPVEQ
ncbi:OmpA family protein [Asticcacaulis sp. ZE23SCel15]|uniref:OmpA family protein n=1 Tax=Asticcacaulis sp. ZE23SCel15 TaxID=3059027 RepID=UPI00265E9DE4|nr:OmpA family protein [Asticcacaulis sp. ZE23SCel15]WKL58138.1 OmpA family protein [Asticcacaulis sp. ZE23SCel15]